MSNSLQPHGLHSPWNSPGQNTGVGSLSLPHGIFPTQGSNPGLPHCKRIPYQLSCQGSLTALVHNLFGNWRLFFTKYSPEINKYLFFFFCIWPFLPLSFLVFPSPLCLDCQAYQNLFSEQTHILSVMVYFFPSKKCFSPTVLLSMPSHIRGAVGRSCVQPPGPS